MVEFLFSFLGWIDLRSGLDDWLTTNPFSFPASLWPVSLRAWYLCEERSTLVEVIDAKKVPVNTLQRSPALAHAVFLYVHSCSAMHVSRTLPLHAPLHTYLCCSCSLHCSSVHVHEDVGRCRRLSCVVNPARKCIHVSAFIQVSLYRGPPSRENVSFVRGGRCGNV